MTDARSESVPSRSRRALPRPGETAARAIGVGLGARGEELTIPLAQLLANNQRLALKAIDQQAQASARAYYVYSNGSTYV